MGNEANKAIFTRRELVRLIVPLVIEQVLAVTIGMADTVMVSSVGEAAVSGISLVDTINILLINIFSALATGGAVIASQYIGRQDTEHACVAAKQLILCVTFLSGFITVLSLVGCNPILHTIFGNVDPEVMENARTYFLLSAMSYPFLGIYNAGAALFRSMGNSKISMFASLLMNVINISGNAVLIYQFHLGVLGAAVASLASRIVGAVIMLLLLRNRGNLIHIDSYFRLGFRPEMIRRILKIGVPNGLENGMFQIGKILVQSLIASFGTAAIAANAVAGNIASMEVMPGSAIGLALITVVGQCIGAGDYKQAKAYTMKLMKVIYITMFFLNIIILLNISGIIGFYHLPQETTDMAVTILLYHSICCMVIWPASFALPNALRAANDVKFTMGISILSMWIFRIGFSYLLGSFFALGVLGVWLAMFVDWLFRSIVFIVRISGSKWKTKQVI